MIFPTTGLGYLAGIPSSPPVPRKASAKKYKEFVGDGSEFVHKSYRVFRLRETWSTGGVSTSDVPLFEVLVVIKENFKTFHSYAVQKRLAVTPR